MKLDLTGLEQAAEQVVDTAIAAIPGNPVFALPAERAVLHGLFVGLAGFISGKLEQAAPESVVPSQPTPTDAPAVHPEVLEAVTAAVNAKVGEGAVSVVDLIDRKVGELADKIAQQQPAQAAS